MTSPPPDPAVRYEICLQKQICILASPTDGILATGSFPWQYTMNHRSATALRHRRYRLPWDPLPARWSTERVLYNAISTTTP